MKRTSPGPGGGAGERGKRENKEIQGAAPLGPADNRAI